MSELLRKKPSSCSKCLEEVLCDHARKSELRWDEYGMELQHCKVCIDALKIKMDDSKKDKNA